MTYLISLILLLLPTYLIRFSIFGIPSTLLEVLIFIVFFYGLYRAFKEGFRPISWKIYLPVSLLLIALIVSTLISPDKRTALGEFKGFFIDPLLVGWLTYQNVKEKPARNASQSDAGGDITKLFWGLIGSGLFVSVYTIIQKILGQVTADGRVIGIFGYSPNYVALFLAPIAVLLVAYGLQLTAQRKYWFSAVSCLLLAVSLIAIYFSGSRGGFLAIAGGVGIFVILRYWSRIRARLGSQIMIVILIIIAIATSWTLFKPDLSASPEAGRVASSNNVRYQIWQTSIELGKLHPVSGVGLGNFQSAFGDLTQNRANFSEYITPLALTPHNIFLMFWLSTGILGLVAFIWLLVEFFRKGFSSLKKPLRLIILAVMASIIIYGLVESSIWKNDLAIIFWTFWSLIWTVENAKVKSQNAK